MWSLQGGRYTSIFEAVNAIASHLAPPITTVFIWGVFWRTRDQTGGLNNLIVGFSLGAVSFLIDLPVIGKEKVITDGWGIPFMMQAWWMFCLCSVIYVVVSLLTPPPDPEQVEGLTWKNPLQVLTQGKIQSLWDPRLLAAALLLVMIVLYYILR